MPVDPSSYKAIEVVMIPGKVEMPTDTLEKQVADLLEEWRRETAPLSSSRARTSHPAYQKIIALGPAVLPALLRDMKRTQDGHLSKILVSLTAASPVTNEERGKPRAVAEAWLRLRIS
jgi:hypothetical protein